MIPRAKLILLDTNVVIELARDKASGKAIAATLDLAGRPERPLTSVVSLGEALALAEQWSWGDEKSGRLRELFRELVVVDLSFGKTPERYGRIAAYSRANGLGIGENDRWIAATAAEAEAHLVTTDQDFGPLDPTFISHTLISWADPGQPSDKTTTL
ncbi:MAG TPA: type II toxin-antitoxin system VapC family toxin [Gemmatimonadales bacterium]